MTWGNPPKLEPAKPKPGKVITPEDLAKTGTEDGHQAALFCWCAMSVDKYPQLKWIFAIPNGGSRHIAEAVKFVGAGTRSGVPDLMLPVAIQWDYEPARYHGCFIEMKKEMYRNRKNGGCSDEQIKYIEYLRSEGYYCKVCYSWTEARDTLIAYLEGKL